MQTQQSWSWSPKVCSENPQAHTTLFLYQCQFADMADTIPKPSFIKWLIHQWAFLTLENPNKCLCNNLSSREQSPVGQSSPVLPQQTQQAGPWTFIGRFFSSPVLFSNANKIPREANPIHLEAVTFFRSSAMLQHISRGSRTKLDLQYLLSPAQPGTAALAEVSQVCPGLLPNPSASSKTLSLSSYLLRFQGGFLCSKTAEMLLSNGSRQKIQFWSWEVHMLGFMLWHPQRKEWLE